VAPFGEPPSLPFSGLLALSGAFEWALFVAEVTRITAPSLEEDAK